MSFMQPKIKACTESMNEHLSVDYKTLFSRVIAASILGLGLVVGVFSTSTQAQSTEAISELWDTVG